MNREELIEARDRCDDLMKRPLRLSMLFGEGDRSAIDQGFTEFEDAYVKCKALFTDKIRNSLETTRLDEFIGFDSVAFMTLRFHKELLAKPLFSLGSSTALHVWKWVSTVEDLEAERFSISDLWIAQKTMDLDEIGNEIVVNFGNDPLPNELRLRTKREFNAVMRNAASDLPAKPKKKPIQRRINDRMLCEANANPKSASWTATEWKTCLDSEVKYTESGVSLSGIKGSKAWRSFGPQREARDAERDLAKAKWLIEGPIGRSIGDIFETEPLDLDPVIVGGLIREGEIANLIAPSKLGKLRWCRFRGPRGLLV